jgi:hypothetical protein
MHSPVFYGICAMIIHTFILVHSVDTLTNSYFRLLILLHKVLRLQYFNLIKTFEIKWLHNQFQKIQIYCYEIEPAFDFFGSEILRKLIFCSQGWGICVNRSPQGGGGFCCIIWTPWWGICNVFSPKWQMPDKRQGGMGLGTHGIDWDITMLYSPICVWAQRIEPSFYYTNNLFTFLFHFTFLQSLIVVSW